MLIYDLFDKDLLIDMIAEGYIRKQQHPALPYTILNYTERTQFDRKWNGATLNCRGLIYNHDTEEIIARPFPKFFNYGEEDVDHSYYSSSVVVTDKMDGSLGILYPTDKYKTRLAAYAEGDSDKKFIKEYAIATRGSFTSSQAVHATKILNEKYPEWQRVEPTMTYLFEIIYPENRIVCNYGKMDDLVFLGAVSLEDGWTCGPGNWLQWPGPKAKMFDCKTFQEAIEMPPRPGAEGIVVHFSQSDKRLKIKQADYVQLHRMITGLNERSVWSMLREGKIEEDICADLPDEFHQWVHDTASGLTDKYSDLIAAVSQKYKAITNSLDEDFGTGQWNRKDFALRAVKTDYASFMFALLDGRFISDDVWKRIRPESIQSQWAQSEDSA